MSQDEAIIKGALDYVLAHSFENYRDYQSYFIRIRPKELVSKHGHYKRRERLIEVFNLSREPRFTMLTCLHELAHHIEYEDLGESEHTSSFYERYFALLIVAIGLGYLERSDIKEEHDSGDYGQLVAYYGEVETWEIPVFPHLEKRMVVVKNSYEIRGILKKRNFKFFTMSQTWQKEFPDLETAEIEKKELLKVGKVEDIYIQYVNQVNFLIYYYIGVLNGYEYRYGLKELGYVWEGYGLRDVWVKKVDATAFYEETHKLTQFAGIEFKKMTPNLTKPTPKKKAKKQEKKQIIQYYF